MAEGFILYHNGFYSLPNDVACCNRLTGDTLKLLGLIMNRVNTAKVRLPTEIAMPRLLLKRVLGNGVDRTVKNYAKRLRELGFIESFWLQGGDGGEFVCTINALPENNPYVLLSCIENEVISLAKLQAGQGAVSLLQAFTAAVQAVEHDYVVRLRNAAENERETILAEYRSYLSDKLQADGKVTLRIGQTKKKTKQSTFTPIETALPEDVEQWSNLEFESHFLREYQKTTNKIHIAKSRVGKTVADCIQALEHHYRDRLKAERKPMMKKHIEAFLVNYPPSKTIDPKAFLMADPDTLYKVEQYLENGIKRVPYEERSSKDNKSEPKASQARQGEQRRLGLSGEDFLKRIQGGSR